MDDLASTRELLNSQVDALLETNALAALQAVGAVQRDMTERQQQAVLAAAPLHSWSEIAEVLGVSRQAAHQKFAKDWVDGLKAEVKSKTAEVKAEHRAMKAALREGDDKRAAEARARRDALVSELKALS